MYKIENRENRKTIKAKNLKQLEWWLIRIYKGIEEEIDINDLYYTDIFKVDKYDIIAHLYAKDYYGNPLYMIIIYDTETGETKTIKSKQSYNIKDTCITLLKKYQ